jgi:hypothetical protein
MPVTFPSEREMFLTSLPISALPPRAKTIGLDTIAVASSSNTKVDPQIAPFDPAQLRQFFPEGGQSSILLRWQYSPALPAVPAPRAATRWRRREA